MNPLPTLRSPHSQRVFLVENDVDFRDCLALYLKLKGHTVFCATTMAEALASLPAASCDVLICDIRLPDGDGWQLLKRLRLSNPIYAIAMSGVGAYGDQERSEAAGYHHHLLKPFPPSKLAALLEQTLPEPPPPRLQTRRPFPASQTDAGFVPTSFAPDPFRILVAEDHEGVREAVGRIILSILPTARIVGTADGRQALAAFEAKGCDMLLADQQMPFLDGLALIRAVRAQAPLLPILMVSVHPGIEAEALAAGATVCVPKHRLVEHLPALLGRYAEGAVKAPGLTVS